MCRCLIVVCARLCGIRAGRFFLAFCCFQVCGVGGDGLGLSQGGSHTLWFSREECLSELASWSWVGSFRYFL